MLAAGYGGDGQPFIVDVDPHGLIGRYEEVGFHAIGSGSAMAQQAGALLAHFKMTERMSTTVCWRPSGYSMR